MSEDWERLQKSKHQPIDTAYGAFRATQSVLHGTVCRATAHDIFGDCGPAMILVMLSCGNSTHWDLSCEVPNYMPATCTVALLALNRVSLLCEVSLEWSIGVIKMGQHSQPEHSTFELSTNLSLNAESYSRCSVSVLKCFQHFHSCMSRHPNYLHIITVYHASRPGLDGLNPYINVGALLRPSEKNGKRL